MSTCLNSLSSFILSWRDRTTPRLDALQPKQPTFHVKPSGKAGQMTISADNPVARDDDRERIHRQTAPHRASSRREARLFR